MKQWTDVVRFHNAQSDQTEKTFGSASKRFYKDAFGIWKGLLLAVWKEKRNAGRAGNLAFLLGCRKMRGCF